jgi:dGTPase
MYRHARVGRIMGEAENVVRDLFARYAAAPELIPVEWSQTVDASEASGRLRRVADFIAGMTDRYALIEHARLFEVTPELR